MRGLKDLKLKNYAREVECEGSGNNASCEDFSKRHSREGSGNCAIESQSTDSCYRIAYRVYFAQKKKTVHYYSSRIWSLDIFWMESQNDLLVRDFVYSLKKLSLWTVRA